MRTLLDACFYSILYYNAVIWLTPQISCVMKQSLLSISANALRSCMLFRCNEISFERIHLLCEKRTPKQITSYQIALKLHKLMSDIDVVSFEQCTVLDGIVCSGRQLTIETYRNNRYKIGMNTTLNKLYHIFSIR